jgi:hypothetical protein
VGISPKVINFPDSLSLTALVSPFTSVGKVSVVNWPTSTSQFMRVSHVEVEISFEGLG